MKKLLAIILTLLLLCAVAVPASAVKDEDKIYDTSNRITIDLACEVGADYSIGYEPGTPYGLFLEGEGRLLDFDYENPENNTSQYENNAITYMNAMYFFDQKYVFIGDGITYIGNGFFEYYTKVRYIYIPNSVTEISETAFAEDNDITVLAYADSYAIEYAIAHDMDYKIINDESTMLGDVNSDKAVNGKDVLTLRKYIVGIVNSFSINKQNADVNNDGKINGKDVLMLRKALVGLIDLVPAETPSDLVDTPSDIVETPADL